MMNHEKHLDEVRAALGYKHLSRVWAKVEILFGLGAAGIGMLVGGWAIAAPKVQLPWAGVGLALFVLGWYLALAGTRSHLYRSMNDLTALLIEEIRKMEKGKSTTNVK